MTRTRSPKKPSLTQSYERQMEQDGSRRIYARGLGAVDQVNKLMQAHGMPNIPRPRGKRGSR
jgi:hypothetical protein